MEESVVTARRRRRELPCRPQEDNVGDEDLDESDDEDVTKGRGQPAIIRSSEDTDSAMEDEDMADGSANNDDLYSSSASGHVQNFFEGLPPRWRNWVIRGCSGCCLISGFTTLVWLGPIGLLFLTYLVVTSCYSEATSLAYQVTGVSRNAFKHLVWAFYVVTQFYLAGAPALRHLAHVYHPIFDHLADMHLLISSTAYVACLVWFVLILDKDYLKSYALFAWCHLFLLFGCVPGQLMNSDMLNGMIWYVLPMTLITLNDIAAFYVGFFAGKTPLIKLSPKKTYEGFVGGGIITVLLGTFLASYMVTPYLICPVQVSATSNLWSPFTVDTDCTPNSVFIEREMQLFGWLSVTLRPFLLHSVAIAALCSLIGPFGGFLASGFKRGCRRKNFGSFIPGHGGITDRCDCMFLCAFIMHVYRASFIQEGMKIQP